MDLALELVDEFMSFERRRRPEGGNSYLSDCFDDWIIEGDAIDRTAGDFTLLLQTFILTAARFVEHPEQFDGMGIEGLVLLQSVPGGKRDILPTCLHPDSWKIYVFRRKYGHRIWSPPR